MASKGKTEVRPHAAGEESKRRPLLGWSVVNVGRERHWVVCVAVLWKRWHLGKWNEGWMTLVSVYWSISRQLIRTKQESVDGGEVDNEASIYPRLQFYLNAVAHPSHHDTKH